MTLENENIEEVLKKRLDEMDCILDMMNRKYKVVQIMSGEALLCSAISKWRNTEECKKVLDKNQWEICMVGGHYNIFDVSFGHATEQDIKEFKGKRKGLLPNG